MPNRYNIENIRKCTEELLISKGMQRTDAMIFADSMLQADIHGVSTHGIRMLPSYIEKINRNEFSFEKVQVIKQYSAFTIIDALNTIGAVSAIECVEIAIKKAKSSGIHIVFSRNSNTFGPGFYYAEKIAESGMLGLVCCNTPAAMPAFNGLEAMLGTNPLAFACPTKSYGNIVVDMATSVVAKSRFGVAKAKGELLQPGWGLNLRGEPTVDPDEAIKGFVLPMAGFKGYGIAMMIDLVSGLLSGAGYLNNVGKFYSNDRGCMNVGHCIVAFNPQILYEGDFLEAADQYINILKSSKTVQGKSIVLPGDDRKQNEMLALKNGIELTDDVAQKLEVLFEKKLF